MDLCQKQAKLYYILIINYCGKLSPLPSFSPNTNNMNSLVAQYNLFWNITTQFVTMSLF